MRLTSLSNRAANPLRSRSPIGRVRACTISAMARAFALPDAADHEYVIQGPEPMTYAEAAARYAHAKGLYVVKVPLALLSALGLFSRHMAFNARMMRTVLSYPEQFKAQAAWDTLGRPTTTLADFAKRG